MSAGPVLTADRFRPLAAELVMLLRSLPPAAWSSPATPGGWEVRDVVAHLLDGDLRRISAERDAHSPPAPPAAFQGYSRLVEYLDRMNARWVSAARRLSPRLMTDLLEFTGAELATLVEAADPMAPALYPVAWAGEGESRLWFDHGREFTERWHHQDQVRAAVGAPPLDGPEWLRPVLDISVRALPHACRELAAPHGTAIALEITGPAAAYWSLVRNRAEWTLEPGPPAAPACTITAPGYPLAQLLLHRLPRGATPAVVRVAGDENLAAPLLRARAVMV